jgi:hypothetical protein
MPTLVTPSFDLEYRGGVYAPVHAPVHAPVKSSKLVIKSVGLPAALDTHHCGDVNASIKSAVNVAASKTMGLISHDAAFQERIHSVGKVSLVLVFRSRSVLLSNKGRPGSSRKESLIRPSSRTG